MSLHPPNEGHAEGRLKLALWLTFVAADSPRNFQCHRDHVDLVSLTGAAELCDLHTVITATNITDILTLCLDINRKLFSRNYDTKHCTPSHQLKAIKFRWLTSIFTFILQLGPQPLAFLVHQTHNFSPIPSVPLTNRSPCLTSQITRKTLRFSPI